MVNIKLKCPICNTDDISRNGFTINGKQRYCCNNDSCENKSFLIDYTYNACKVNTKEKIIVMAMNGSGIRDTARVLEISPSTVIDTLKKRKFNI